MSDNVIIISSFRSLNKTIAHTRSLKSLGIKPYIITNFQGKRLTESVYYDQYSTYIYDQLTDIKTLLNKSKAINPKFIITVTDELLYLIPELEDKCGLPLSISQYGATLLSNKYLFENFCNSFDIPNMRTIIPKNEDDFLKFHGPCLLKPTIGSGQYYNFKDYDSNEYFEYRYFECGRDLFVYLKKINKDTLILSANTNHDFAPDRYGNRPVQFMLQEYVESNKEISCNGSIINGQLNMFSTGQLFKSAQSEDSHIDLISLDRLGRAQHYTEHQFYIMGPPREFDEYNYFFNQIISRLKIKNLLFSGPDLFFTNDNYYFSDFNPRTSGQLCEISSLHIQPFLNEFWSKCLDLKPETEFESNKKHLVEFVGVGAPYIKSGEYQYTSNKDQVHFTNSQFIIDKKYKSMDYKKSSTKLVIHSDSFQSVIELFNQIPNFVVKK